MIYLCKRFENSDELHSIVIKYNYAEWIIVIAIGYGGGQVFEEFCGKFKFESDKKLTGFYSNSHDPDIWEFQILNDKTKEIDEILNDADKKIIRDIVKEIWKEYLIYEEVGDQITRRISPKYMGKMKEGVYTSEDWISDGLKFISEEVWGLLLLLK